MRGVPGRPVPHVVTGKQTESNHAAYSLQRASGEAQRVRSG